MQKPVRDALAIFVNFAFCANQLLADLPPIDFEAVEWVPYQSVGQGAQPGWQLVSGSAMVSGVGEGLGGGKSLKIPVSPLTESRISRAVAWDSNEQTAFIDLQMKPALDPSGAYSTLVANGTQIAFQVPDASTTGEIWVQHGADGIVDPGVAPKQWIKTAGTFTVPPNGSTAADFIRITLRHDYLRNLWDLFIDGKLAAANLAFDDRGANLESLEFFGSEIGDALIDDLSAQSMNMLFPDADKDGLSDVWEDANGSNKNLYDRDSIKPGTSDSFLDSYMDSLWLTRGINGNSEVPAHGSIPDLSIEAEAPHEAVGALKGSLSIGGDGSANYSIPIDLPKGTGGMEPKLSLGYSSGSGNGIVGVGWNLTGLQRITRGPSSASAEKNDNFDPMDFDGNDRFFLDGERLVYIGTYGAAGSEYRTELDSFARITAVGAGPVSWKIETKAGLIVELGKTADSKIAVQGGTLSWGANRVADTVGNYYSVEYARDAETPDSDFVNHRVAAVRYTGNTTKNVEPYCSVEFFYEGRSDTSRSFSTHAGFRSNKRLSKIRVLTGSYVNHTYRLAYENSYQTGRSFLKSATKHMRDSDSLFVPSTTFTYAGLQRPAAGDTTSPLWKNPWDTDIPVYGNDLDATDEVNSMVTTELDGNLIRLTGDVARAYRLPGSGVNIHADTKLQFEFHSSKQVAGAVIGLDSDTVYQNATSTSLYRIGGNNTTLNMSNGNFQGTTLPYTTADGWKTFTVNIGSLGTGMKNFLVLMCADNNSGDGTDNASFRNVKIYRPGLTPLQGYSPIVFNVDAQLPRYASSDGKDLGIVAADFDSDGLVDLADWRVTNYSAANSTLTPSTSGFSYKNTGNGFLLAGSLRPPAALPLGCRATDEIAYGYNSKHHLLAQPVDVDGDGKLDLMAPVNIDTHPGYLANEYAFYSLVNGTWVVRPEWKLPFRLVNADTNDSYGGKRRDDHFQWTDLNADGYQDLIVHTTSNGRLFNISTGAQMLNIESGIAFLNNGKNGPGWTRDNSLFLPLSLMPDGKDAGRRLLDLDGDGVPELAKSIYEGGVLDKRTYFLAKTGDYRWKSNWQDGVPLSHPYDLPIGLVLSSGNPSEALLLDVNADGLVDCLAATKNQSGFISRTWLNQGSRTSSPWRLETSPNIWTNTEDTYRIPYPLHYESQMNDSNYRIPYGFETADLNGDGLLDVLYSDVENAATPGSDNLAFLNTGNGWRADQTWGLPVANRIYTSADDRTDGKRRAKLQDIDGDGFPDLITGLLDQTPKVWFNQCGPEVLTGVVDGMGSDLGVSYKRLNDPTPTQKGFESRVYEKGTATLPPGQVSIIDSRLVVCTYSEPNGQGGRRYRYQRYGDLRYDRKNESSLGFAWIEARDDLNNQINRVEYSQVYPFGGSPLVSKSYVRVEAGDLSSVLPGVTVGDKLMSVETARYAELPSQSGVGGIIRRPVQTYSEKTLYDLAGVLVSSTSTSQNFDDYGFVTSSNVLSLDGATVATVNTYVHNLTNWQLGRLSGSTVQKYGAGKPLITKKSSFGYHPTTGLLLSETVEPESPLASTKSYEHDGFGNVIKTVLTTAGIPPRFTTSSYDPLGRFVLSETNQLEHKVLFNYGEGNQALLHSTTGITGKTTAFSYDPFGTLTRTDHPDGTQTGESTGKYRGTLPPSVASKVGDDVIAYTRAKQTSGSPVAKVYLDPQGRELVSETTILRSHSADGTATYSKVYTATQHDSLGRTTAVSEAFAEGEDPKFTRITNDVLSRVLTTTHTDDQSDAVLSFKTQYLPDPATSLPVDGPVTGRPVSYSMTRNRNGGILERWEDQHGRLVMSKDLSGQRTSFSHDHEGRILSVSIDNVGLLTNTFDLLGNKTDVWEKNSGTSTSTYNAFGEVTNSTNAKGQTSSFTFDPMGRPETVTKPEGTYTTYYDGPDASALGKPWRTTGPDSYEETVSFDGLGRPTGTRKTQRTPGQGLETFTTATTYDVLSRVVTGTDAGGLTLCHQYATEYSFPTVLKLGSSAPGSGIHPGAGKVLWQAGTYDTKGRATSQILAQGVATTATYKPDTNHVSTLKASQADGTTLLQDKIYGWDTLGNLGSRTDALSGRTETFGYDGLNRVTSATVSGTGGPPVANFGYDPNGNLTSKPGAALAYGGSRPHAVTSATVKNASRTYAYDAAGYVTADGKRTFIWTSFGQLSSLDYLSAPALQNFAGIQIYAPSQVQTNFYFDAGGNRSSQLKQRIAADDSRILEETLYLGSYERETHSTRTSGTSTPDPTRTVHRHSIGGFAVYTSTELPGIAGKEVKLTTLLKDHLGSTDVLHTGTWTGNDFTNPVTEKQSFDSWGERRDPATLASYRATDADPFRTSGQDYDRGYTGHEQLDDSGLIHMNGRLYDPELGRMLSPDPFVQVPEYSQNFNRYSYVMNNPLNLTDPSGFSWLSDAFKSIGSWLKENWRTVVVIVVVAVISIVSFGTLTGAAAAAGGALLGATATAAVTASVGAWAVAAVGGAFLGGIAGGLSAALAGGDMGDVLRGAVIGGISGALAAGLTASGVGGVPEVVGQGVVGGAKNVAMGGKFQDGFLSAAASSAAQSIPYANTGVAGLIKSSVVGGTASSLGGGKFANGASTAAFQYLVTSGLESSRTVKMYVSEGYYDRISNGGEVDENGPIGGQMRGDLDASAPEMRAAAGETGLIMASLIPLGRVLSTTGRFIGSVGVRMGRFVGIGKAVAPAAARIASIGKGRIGFVTKSGEVIERELGLGAGQMASHLDMAAELGIDTATAQGFSIGQRANGSIFLRASGEFGGDVSRINQTLADFYKFSTKLIE